MDSKNWRVAGAHDSLYVCLCFLIDFAVDFAAHAGSVELCGRHRIRFFSAAVVSAEGTRLCVSIRKVYHQQDVQTNLKRTFS